MSVCLEIKYAEIPYADPVEYVGSLGNRTDLVFFDGANTNNQLNAYSYLLFNPYDKLVYPEVGATEGDGNVFERIDDLLKTHFFKKDDRFPPFQGGMAGYFSYDLCRDLENMAVRDRKRESYPRLTLGLYDVVVSFDHRRQKAWVLSTGLPELDDSKREARANKRLSDCLDLLNRSFDRKRFKSAAIPLAEIRSNFTRDSYVTSVNRVIDYIRAGDIFEANLSQRFHAALPQSQDPFGLYLQLRKVNPAPFSAYLAFDDLVIASSSPERFISVSDGVIQTRPIKGTIKRSSDKESDQYLKKKLETSEKDRSENIMIVDLMRNDLSKICKPGTIRVPQLCGLETYETVHHLVSVVVGELQETSLASDVLKAVFPGGSITGAPKIRAMQIIDELEPDYRGAYCGSIGYIGFNGEMDTSILIRSFVIHDQVVTFHAGGAVVYDSNPEQEYEETLVKAKALFWALTGSSDSTTSALEGVLSWSC